MLKEEVSFPLEWRLGVIKTSFLEVSCQSELLSRLFIADLI